jgi:hypothetical protein
MSSDDKRRFLRHEPAKAVTYSSPPRGHKVRSTLAHDPLTLLWQGADERETGAEAVEAIRARRRSLGPQRTSKKHF